jgi:hypothetical protein
MSGGVPTTISLPFVFDLSAQSIVVFGEDVSAASLDASFNLTIDMSSSIFASSLLYKDADACGNIDISYVPLAGGLQYEINRLNVGSSISDADSYKLVLASVSNPANAGGINYNQYSRTQGAISYPPTPASLRQHFLQYLASIMFGHPQAQAPIKNDNNILTDMSNCDLGLQFATRLGDASDIRHSILEQLIAADVSGDRFDISDNDGNYHQYPFLAGDKIVFRVAMQGILNADSPTALQSGTVSNANLLFQLFNGIPGLAVTAQSTTGTVQERYWKVTITLV